MCVCVCVHTHLTLYPASSPMPVVAYTMDPARSSTIMGRAPSRLVSFTTSSDSSGVPAEGGVSHGGPTRFGVCC